MFSVQHFHTGGKNQQQQEQNDGAPDSSLKNRRSSARPHVFLTLLESPQKKTFTAFSVVAVGPQNRNRRFQRLKSYLCRAVDLIAMGNNKEVGGASNSKIKAYLEDCAQEEHSTDHYQRVSVGRKQKQELSLLFPVEFPRPFPGRFPPLPPVFYRLSRSTRAPARQQPATILNRLNPDRREGGREGGQEVRIEGGREAEEEEVGWRWEGEVGPSTGIT